MCVCIKMGTSKAYIFITYLYPHSGYYKCIVVLCDIAKYFTNNYGHPQHPWYCFIPGSGQTIYATHLWCDPNMTPGKLASAVASLAQYLHVGYSVKSVVVAQMLQRLILPKHVPILMHGWRQQMSKSKGECIISWAGSGISCQTV